MTVVIMHPAQYMVGSFFLPRWSGGKGSACQYRDAGDAGSIPGLGGSPGRENGKLLQYSCLGNPMDRRAWRATVHGVVKSQTRLSSDCTHTTQ